MFLTVSAKAQDDPDQTPLGDVARDMRKKNSSSEKVIDNDNLTQVMDQAESQRASGSALTFLMAGASHGFHVSTADVTCSLSFSANTKALLSSQYGQMDLPASDMVKLLGPATIEGDALTVSIFNGTDWHVSEVDIALTVVKKNLAVDGQIPPAIGGTPSSIAPIVAANSTPPTGVPDSGVADSEVRQERKPDVTVIYRMRAAASPWARTVFSAPLNMDLSPGDEWHWALVQAKGYPPQSYNGNPDQATVTNATAPSSQLPVIPASLLQQDAPASTLSDNPR